MALTAAERLTVFEIFDFPPNAQVFVMWGILGQDQAVQQYSFRSPIEALDTQIAAGTAEIEDRVREIIAEWKTVSTSEVRLDRAEDISGVVRDSEAKRKLLRRRLQICYPVFLENELEQRHAEQQGLAGRIMRG